MKPETVLEKMSKLLVQGRVYRRSDFTSVSSNVDRNLKELVNRGELTKLQNGLYLRPRKTPFGEALADEDELLQKFLDDDHFVVYGPSMFNSLGLGTTQLYNEKVVFNRKRHGVMSLGGRTYTFYRWKEAPKKLSKEFLLVEMFNRLDDLSENKDLVVSNLKKKLSEFNLLKLNNSLNRFGTKSTQKKLKSLIRENHVSA
jgi:hypothetical protein